VVNLQAELAYTQARLSTLQRHPPSASLIGSDLMPSSNMSTHFDPPQQTSVGLSSFPSSFDQVAENEQLQVLTREFVSRYLPGVRFHPSTST
ncbi:hypothetical protein Goari_013486, partial [Gossypium aridum]|nr:hypothetical protein [Gossypium aridum]